MKYVCMYEGVDVCLKVNMYLHSELESSLALKISNPNKNMSRDIMLLASLLIPFPSDWLSPVQSHHPGPGPTGGLPVWRLGGSHV